MPTINLMSTFLLRCIISISFVATVHEGIDHDRHAVRFSSQRLMFLWEDLANVAYLSGLKESVLYLRGVFSTLSFQIHLFYINLYHNMILKLSLKLSICYRQDQVLVRLYFG